MKLRRKRPTMTREYLEAHGVTKITEDGKVFMEDGEEGIIYKLPCKHEKSGKTQYYKALCIRGDDIKERQKKLGQSVNGREYIVLSRAMWTWFNGSCPGDMDVDHINNDNLDDRLENLQLMTHSDNIKKRGHGINQYLCKLNKEDRDAYCYCRDQIKKQIKDKQLEIIQVQEQIASLFRYYASLGLVYKCSQNDQEYLELKQKKEELRELKKLLEDLKKEFFNKEN